MQTIKFDNIAKRRSEFLDTFDYRFCFNTFWKSNMEKVIWVRYKKMSLYVIAYRFDLKMPVQL